jgi:hypothetical protein
MNGNEQTVADTDGGRKQRGLAARPEREGPGGARMRDREGGRDLTTPQTTPNPRPARASSGRRNSPTHPWNRTLSRRQRTVNAAPTTGEDISI